MQKAIVLAAGQGKRLRSEQAKLPKVMRELGGQPLLWYVLRQIGFIAPEDIVIVTGFMADVVESRFGGAYTYARQPEQRGTGHAVMQAAAALAGYDGPVLVCYGDMPLLQEETYRRLFHVHETEGNACTLLCGVSEIPLPYGRVIFDASGRFAEVVEDRDCTPRQKAIRDLNVGVYVFDAKALFAALPQLTNRNAQGEYYLTDVPRAIQDAGGKIGVARTADVTQILGVNTEEDLARCERILEEQAGR